MSFGKKGLEKNNFGKIVFWKKCPIGKNGLWKKWTLEKKDWKKCTPTVLNSCFEIKNFSILAVKIQYKFLYAKPFRHDFSS